MSDLYLTSEQLVEMVQAWAEHSTIPFQGQERNPEIEKALRLSILLAFNVVEGTLPKLRGMRFGYAWDKDNKITVAVAPRDELTSEMLIVSVGEKIGA